MPSTDDAQTWLTTAEVAQKMRVHSTTVLRKTKSGELPAVRLGPRTFRYRPDEVDAFIDKAAACTVEEARPAPAHPERAMSNTT